MIVSDCALLPAPFLYRQILQKRVYIDSKYAIVEITGVSILILKRKVFFCGYIYISDQRSDHSYL